MGNVVTSAVLPTRNVDLTSFADHEGLRRFLVLFVMELSTRKVEVAGMGPAPDGLWMTQIARNLTAGDDGILNGKRYLIHDRDPLFTAEFLKILADMGVQSVKLPPLSIGSGFARTTVKLPLSVPASLPRRDQVIAPCSVCVAGRRSPGKGSTSQHCAAGRG